MLKSELESEEDNANGAHFETDDPHLNQYIVSIYRDQIMLSSLTPSVSPASGSLPRRLDNRYRTSLHVLAR